MSEAGVWPCRMTGFYSNHLDPDNNPRDARTLAHRTGAVRRSRILDDLSRSELRYTFEEPIQPFDFQTTPFIEDYPRGARFSSDDRFDKFFDDEEPAVVFDPDEAAEHGFGLVEATARGGWKMII